MRLFIAINFNDATRSRLVSLRDELQGASNRGRFTHPENLHLTLAFLGECHELQAASAMTAMNAISFEPFELSIDRIGRFKRNGSDIFSSFASQNPPPAARLLSGTWWAGICENKVLLELQQNLTNRLWTNGLECDKRKYSPHITLGREIITQAQPRQIEPFGEMVTSIELMKSERIGGKLTYTAIHAVKAKA